MSSILPVMARRRSGACSLSEGGDPRPAALEAAAALVQNDLPSAESRCARISSDTLQTLRRCACWQRSLPRPTILQKRS